MFLLLCLTSFSVALLVRSMRDIRTFKHYRFASQVPFYVSVRFYIYRGQGSHFDLKPGTGGLGTLLPQGPILPGTSSS